MNASVRFSLNIGNPGPTVVMAIPVLNLKSTKMKLLASCENTVAMGGKLV